MYILTVIDPDLGDKQDTAETTQELGAILQSYLRLPTVLRVIVEVKE